MHCHYINGTQNANLFNLARIELLLFAPDPSFCTYVLGKLDRFIIFFFFVCLLFFCCVVDAILCSGNWVIEWT